MLRIVEHDRILELRLDRPPANALHPELVSALRRSIGDAAEQGARALVLSGSPGLFTGGLDVPFLLGLGRDEIGAAWRDFFALLADLAGCPVPVVAAITGHSPAGGAVLSLFCDHRVMAQGNFRIGLNEVQVGIPIPSAIYRAASYVVGSRQAERLCVTGELLGTDEAHRIGLVDELVPIDAVVPRAIDWCESVLLLPPGPMARSRELARRGLRDAVDYIDEGTVAQTVEDWFSEETQRALRALVTRLAERRSGE